MVCDVATDIVLSYSLQQILAIFAFSLVAGFHVQGHIRCTKDAAAAVTLNIKYPFTHYTYTNGSNTELFEYEPLLYSKAGSASQLFVAWGVLSMLYCFIALAVYVVFTANEKMENLVDILVYVVSEIQRSLPQCNTVEHQSHVNVHQNSCVTVITFGSV